ncbi:unnamed protein product [Urochloa humidicola]
MKDVVIDPLRLVFLSLVVAIGASTRWILFLQKISGKVSCLESPVRLVEVHPFPGGWDSSFGDCISGLGRSDDADGDGAAERAQNPVWGSRLLVVGSVYLLRRCWMKMAELRFEVLGDDPRPTCHRGQGTAVHGGRLIRLSKQLDCDGVSPDPECIWPAFWWRRRIDADEGDDGQEDIGLRLFFLFSAVLSAILPEQRFPL